MPLSDRVTVISGASSGIGAALARGFARHPGRVLGLLGRDEARLAGVAESCRAAGATVETGILDMRDRDGVAGWLKNFDSKHGIDCVIANAGISAGGLPGGHPERDGQIYEVFDVNLGGALNLVLPVLPLMQERRAGRIVLISSLAAFAPLPDAPAYSASKAALMTFGLGLRQGMRPHNVQVNVVCPGFVTTPMSQTFLGWKPLEIDADDAARRIQRGLDRNARMIAFPWPLAMVSRLVPFIPERAVEQAMRLFRLSG